MQARRTLFLIALAVILLPTAAFSEDNALRRGISLYGEGRWRDAILELRKAEAAASGTAEGEALYWIALSEMAGNEYEAAVADLDRLLALTPPSPRAAEAAYHKGRALYFLGRYDEAIVLLKGYSDAAPEGPLYPSALYWIGECLYSMGRFSEARSVFSIVVDRFKQSVKYEAATYRIALIDQRGREDELLKLLKWSHEESLKSVEEYQKRERSYEQAITAYQKRIAEMLKDTRVSDLEAQVRELNATVASLRTRLADAETSDSDAATAIADLRAQLAEAQKKADEATRKLAEAQTSPAPTKVGTEATASKDAADRIALLLDMKMKALDLKERLYERLIALEGAKE